MTQTANPVKSGPAEPLTAREFDEIRQLAYRASGLDLKPGKEELVSARLGRLVRAGAFRSYHDYYCHVVGDATGHALAALIDALATNHTAFLREPAHFEFFRDCLIPQLARRKSIELWSAACSTGEEVWTLAFLLNEALPHVSLRIAATDISNKALQFAQQAAYSSERCHAVPGAWLARYFVREDAQAVTYRVAPAIRAQASFKRLNLAAPFAWPGRFPVIFCRNVMIYFDKPTQERLARRLEECLEPGGYLFVGHAESLAGVSNSLEYVRPAIYRRPCS